MNLQLIPNANKAHKMFSVWAATALLIWSGIGDANQAAVLQETGLPANLIPAILAALMIAGRLVHQPSVQPDQP